MRIDAEAVNSAATQALEQSAELRIEWQGISAPLLSVPSRAAGNVSAGTDLISKHADCTSAAGNAIETLADILEHASDALYRCARAFSDTDTKTAERFRIP
ncbi:MAG: hypothetical protein Q4B08_02410 [Propionibacteriaceae bacterium]|nr:hypothetical protein [Propionibacteriaceae bacterium]